MAREQLTCAQSPNLDTGVDYHEAKSLIQSFCASKFFLAMEMQGKDDIAGFKTSSGNSNLALSISYSECDTDFGAVVSIDQSECERAFYRLLDECHGDANQDLGHYGGSLKQGCVLYSIKTEVEEIVRCGENPYPHAVDLSASIFEKGIEDYCSRDLELWPDLRAGVGQQQKFLSETPRGASVNNHVEGGVVVRAQAKFDRQGQIDCLPSKPFSTKGEECRRKLHVIKDRRGGKGGTLSENGANGCVSWTVFGQKVQ